MRQAFNSLEAQGRRITPDNLRAIFGRVPLPMATLYWATQLARPVVQVSMLPHATATRSTEQRAVAPTPSTSSARNLASTVSCSHPWLVADPTSAAHASAAGSSTHLGWIHPDREVS